MELTNAELVMTSITLLPPEEQAKLMEQIKAWQESAIQSGIGAIMDGAAAQPVDKRVAKYVKIRDARAANTKQYEAIDKCYKDCLAAIENTLLATAQEVGTKSFKTDHGTAYIEERMQANIADDQVFFDFVRNSGDLDFFERRLKVGHIKEYSDANAGRVPPGLNIFRELSVKVRRS